MRLENRTIVSALLNSPDSKAMMVVTRSPLVCCRLVIGIVFSVCLLDEVQYASDGEEGCAVRQDTIYLAVFEPNHSNLG